MTVLADTSVWVDYLRRGRSGASSALDGLLASGEVVTCGPVVAELMVGAAVGQRAELWNLLSGLAWSELGRWQWRRVGEVAAALREQGTTVALTDVVIAVAAAEARAALWSRDAGFERITQALSDLRLYRDG